MKRILLSALLVSMLAACGPSQPQQVVQAPQQQMVQQPEYVQAPPQQVIVQQPIQQAPVIVQQDNGAANLATGMLLGHMMANSGPGYYRNAPSYNRQTTVVNKTVIVNNHPAPVVAPAPRVSQPFTVAARPAAPSVSSFRSSSTSSFSRSGSSFGGFSRRR